MKYMNQINIGNINGDMVQIGGTNQETRRDIHVERTQEPSDKYEYDIAVSYAGSQEAFVDRVVKLAKGLGLRVFFQPDSEEKFLAKDLIAEAGKIYGKQSMFVVCFITKDYLERDFTMQEAAIARNRSKDDGRNCLIPIYFQEEKLPGLNRDIAYMDGRKLQEADIAYRLKNIVMEYRSNAIRENA